MRTTSLVALSMLTACGAVDDSEAFPTGVFEMSFQQTASTCSASLQTGTLTATISIDDTGTYYLSALGGDIPASSQSAEHVTFIGAPTDAQLDTCTYTETDTFTLIAKGQNFTGNLQQSLTGSTCAACSVTQAIVGTKTSN